MRIVCDVAAIIGGIVLLLDGARQCGGGDNPLRGLLLIGVGAVFALRGAVLASQWGRAI